MELDKILKLAERFEKEAQVVSAQPGDIQTALERAKLWNISPAVSPFLDAAGLPDNAQVAIAIIVGPGPAVGYNAVVTPKNPNVSKKLSALLKQKFSAPMANAIKAANLTVESPLTVNWLNF